MTIRSELAKKPNSAGLYPVYLTITHHRKVRRMRTSLSAQSNEITKSGKIKPGNLKCKADNLVASAYKALERVSYFDMRECDVDFIVRHIKAALNAENWHVNFLAYAEMYVESLNVSDATKSTYYRSIASMRRYLATLGKVDIDINDINMSFLNGYVQYILLEPKHNWNSHSKSVVPTSKNKKGNGAKLYMAKLTAIFKAARNEFNDDEVGIIRIPRSPFTKVHIKGVPSHGARPVSVEVIRAIIRDNTDDDSMREALDIAIVTFMFMGANLADLYIAREPKNDVWIYNRIKTANRRADNAEMHVKIPAAAKDAIDRLKVGRHKDFWFNINSRYQTKQVANQSVNRKLKAWAKAHGFPEFTLYSLRKAWATIARSSAVGIDKAVVDECLAHVGDYRIADIYIERDWSVIWQANQKVIDYVCTK